MGKKQVIDYVMNSPANTNKAVLEGMLDGVGGVDVPTPTASDNGKYLGVEDGEYALVEASSGSGGTLVTINVALESFEADMKYYSATDTSMPFAEMVQKITDGTPLTIEVVYSDSSLPSGNFTKEIFSSYQFKQLMYAESFYATNINAIDSGAQEGVLVDYSKLIIGFFIADNTSNSGFTSCASGSWYRDEVRNVLFDFQDAFKIR